MCSAVTQDTQNGVRRLPPGSYCHNLHLHGFGRTVIRGRRKLDEGGISCAFAFLICSDLSLIQKRKFPVHAPCLQGVSAETGANCTASPATQSENHRINFSCVRKARYLRPSLISRSFQRLVSQTYVSKTPDSLWANIELFPFFQRLRPETGK